MTVKQLIENYKGDIEVVVKQLSEDEAVDVVSFNVVEKDAIKDDVMDAEISTYHIEVDRQLPANARIMAYLKAVVTADPSDPATP